MIDDNEEEDRETYTLLFISPFLFFIIDYHRLYAVTVVPNSPDDDWKQRVVYFLGGRFSGINDRSRSYMLHDMLVTS